MIESVQCPVCTLYLHAGMNLSDHLETHPKEQVIKALVQMTIAGNPMGPGNALAAAVLTGAALVDAGAPTADVKPTVVGLNGTSSATAAKSTTDSNPSAATATKPSAGPTSASSLPPPLSSAATAETHFVGNSKPHSIINSNKLNNPPSKGLKNAPTTATATTTSASTSSISRSDGSKQQQQHQQTPQHFVRASTTEAALAATSTTTNTAAYQQLLAEDYRYEPHQQQQQQLHAFQHTSRGGMTTTTSLAYSAAALNLQPQQQQHHYITQQQPRHSQVTAPQQAQYSQPSLKYTYATALPPPPPLQLFTQQSAAAQSAQHQKPPPAYGAAISQIRSQHNQNKQQQQQQQQQHITIHQIAPPTATVTATTTTKHSKSNATAHTELFLNPPPPPQPHAMPVALKYLGESASTSSVRLQQQQQPQHLQQTAQQTQQAPTNLNMPLQAFGPVLPSITQQKPSSSCQSSPARSAVASRQSNSPFGALLTAAAAAASASPSSVLRYAESPVAHYLERENGDFIVQETPKHIVECVEKDDGEFSVIERIYQSPPSVLHIHDDDEEEDDDDDENEEQQNIDHIADGDDEQEDSRSRASVNTKKQRVSKLSKTKAKAGKRSTVADQDEEEFMSVSSSSESEEVDQKETQEVSPSAQAAATTAPSPSVSFAATKGSSGVTNSGEANSNSNTNNSSNSGNVKSKKNRITVLSDVPLNMNEYLDLVGNIVASSRIGAARPFAAVAPIPLVKVEKEEPLDEEYDDELTSRFNATDNDTGRQSNEQQLETEQKPSLEEQLHGVTSSSSHATTSVIRMASTNTQQQTPAGEDLPLPLMKFEAECTVLLPQRISTNVQQRGPKKLVIKPKSTTTTAAKTTNKKTDNSTSSSNTTEPIASTSTAAAQSLSISKAAVNELQIKSEQGETPSNSGSILEKHLTTSFNNAAKQARKHSSVNDDDARVLLEFANSKQTPVSGSASTTFVVNASFPSANSVFATNSATSASTTAPKYEANPNDEYILPDNNLDEIVISSSSSFASSLQQPAATSTLPNTVQQEQQNQQQSQATPSFNDFNFLYQSNAATCYDNNVVKASNSGSGNFTAFAFQQQPHAASEATNAATVASSSSSSSAGSAILDHDSMNAMFRVAKAARDQQQQGLGSSATDGSSWYQHQAQPHDGAQPTNFNAALAAVDCCSAAVDSDASDAKYLDLDACKREQLSGSSSSNSLGTVTHLPSASASTTSSSFAAAATESSLVGGLNIRTDEKMPAKGEISEQESNCDIENSWSQSMYGDISTRYFRNQFSGVYNQMPDWRTDYYPAQDLSSQQRESKRFDFRLPVDVPNVSVADYMFATQDNPEAALAAAAHAHATSSPSSSKKAKRKIAAATVTSAAGSSNSGSNSENYLLDAQPTTSSNALLAGPPIASTSRAAAAAAAASSVPTLVVPQQPKPPRRKIYKCPHCEYIFDKLKDRNAHMISVHNYVRQNRRLICTQAAVVTSTITSAAATAQLLPPQPQLLPIAASSSGAVQYDNVVEDSKDGIVKIKQEHCQEQQQKTLPERRDTLTASLGQLHAKTELPDVSDAGLLVEPSSADIKPHDAMLSELDQKPTITPLAMTTPAAKLAALYRMLIIYNESKLGQDRSISELEQKAMEKSIFLCYVCRTDFPSVKLYDAHLTEHPAECFTCGKKFYRWKNFSLHLKRHMGWKEFGCYVCDKKFVVRSALVEHMRMHTGQTPLKCKICGKKFRRYSNLTQHRKRHTKMTVRKKEYVCHCGEVLPSKARFLWHKETHDLKPKCCPYCCDRFVHANSLRRHIRLAHSDKFDYAEPMECPMCKQIFAKTSIKAHMATHSTDPQFDCAICNKSFSTKWNLKIHSWVHANRTAKPFKCEYCPKAFVRELDFKNHMNAHKQIKPYTCEYCGCKFIRKYNYMRHRREHHGNKKFTCDQCDKSFHRHYYLIEHRRIHTGERPFQCTICGKSSTTKTNHNKHLKIHHSRDPFTVEV